MTDQPPALPNSLLLPSRPYTPPEESISWLSSPGKHFASFQTVNEGNNTSSILCFWLLSLNIIFVSFSCIIACTPFIFIAEYNLIAWNSQNLFIQFTIDAHLSYFPSVIDLDVITGHDQEPKNLWFSI